ncbi:ParA family protein [Hydrogenophaga sp.]|uniref:ParA family protein n=1 Tax=Hydrogenophaga sp. TaxID=1904254 RepID=UPI0025B91353|nr:ParA family protein [Hydrogenophaga sp.]
MPVVAVVNRKGGSGKSTLSTNIAGWCAHNGWRVMLGDVDRQQSVRSWLSRRSPQAARITTWALDNGKVFRAPPGTTHVVLDTPGALYGHDLAKLIVLVDAIVVPIGPSMFDRDASLPLLAELAQHPKVRGGRCKVTAIGMRWPKESMEQWQMNGRTWDVPLLTVIPDGPNYRSHLDTGSSVFDEPRGEPIDNTSWEPLIHWLSEVWHQAPPGRPRSEPAKTASAAHAPNTTVDTLPDDRVPNREVITAPRGATVRHSGSPVNTPGSPRLQAPAIPLYLLKSAANTSATTPADNAPGLFQKKHAQVLVRETPRTEKPGLITTKPRVDSRRPPERHAERSTKKKSWLLRLLRMQ